MLFHTHTLSALIAALLYFFSANSFAGDLFDMLKRMSEADQNQNYQGTFILRKSDDLSTLRVTHGMDEEGEWESLEALNGEARKVVRHNNRVITVFPERSLVTIRHTDNNQSLHQQLPENTDQLDLFYSIQRLDDDRVANRQTLVVDLLPKDKYRYGYRYWVDKSTGMLLRCDLVSEDNIVVEQMMFTSLEYLPTAPTRVLGLEQLERFEQRVLDEPEIEIAGEENQGIQGIHWTVEILPKGFMLTQSTMRYSHLEGPHQQGSVHDLPPDLQHLVYSDGLASVSVFIEKNLGVERHLQGVSSRGAMNAFGNPVGDYHATVVGEVPVQTVQSMAQSVARLH